jgi:hypothetical protein
VTRASDIRRQNGGPQGTDAVASEERTDALGQRITDAQLICVDGRAHVWDSLPAPGPALGRGCPDSGNPNLTQKWVRLRSSGPACAPRGPERIPTFATTYRATTTRERLNQKQGI